MMKRLLYLKCSPFFVLFLLVFMGTLSSSWGQGEASPPAACHPLWQESIKVSKKKTPYTGLIFTLKSGAKHLVIGPMLGKGHMALFLEAEDKYGSEISELNWGGELLVSRDGDQFIFHTANETSGFLNEMIQKDDILFSLFPFLKIVKVDKNRVGELASFSTHPSVQFIKSYKGQSFDPKQLHLLKEMNPIKRNNRHFIAGSLQTLTIEFNKRKEGKKGYLSLDEVKKVLKVIVTLTKIMQETSPYTVLKEVNSVLDFFITASEDLLDAEELPGGWGIENWSQLKNSIGFVRDQLVDNPNKATLLDLSVQP